MAFRFPLAAVLRIREINEQREERKLSEILAQLAHTRETIAMTELQLAAAFAKREAELQLSMSAAELHATYGVVASLKERKQLSEEQMIHFEQLRDKQIRVYQGAHQGRQLLSDMRREQHESFVAEQERQQQKGLDDLFIARMRQR